jgi:DNA polymerase-3 subunit gamma/tau
MWQMLLKAYDEVRRAPDPSAAVEMALIRLCYAVTLPGPEEALKALQAGEPIRGGPSPSSSPSPAPPPSGGSTGAVGSGPLRAMTRAAPAIAQAGLRPLPDAAQRTVLQTFDDVLQLIDAKRDVTLKLDVERYVRLVDFKPGVIAFEPAPGAPANLPQRLSGRLKEWTGQPWMMDIQTGGQETGYERDRREEADVRAAVEADPFVTAVRQAFPGAEIIGIRPLATLQAQSDTPVGEASESDAEDD